MTGSDILDGIFGDLADIKSKLESLYGSNKHLYELVGAFERIELRLRKLEEENYLLCYFQMVAKFSGLVKEEMFKGYLPPRSCMKCPYHTQCQKVITKGG